MAKGTAIVKAAHFNSSVLHKKINIGEGESPTIYGANDEDFDIFVYRILAQMYMQRGDIINAYNTFAANWSDRQNRVDALNELHYLNKLRRKRGLQAIPLLAEEESAA